MEAKQYNRGRDKLVGIDSGGLHESFTNRKKQGRAAITTNKIHTWEARGSSLEVSNLIFRPD